jgi:putative SOS response-associated peptidase YedK
MPVLLLPDEYDLWLRGSLDEALALQKRAFPTDLIEMRRTREIWVRRPSEAQAGPALL